MTGSFQWSESNLLDSFKCLSSVALNILLKYCYITVPGLRNTIHTVFIISIPGMTFLIIFVVSAFFGRFTIFDNSTIQFAVLISNKCPRGPMGSSQMGRNTRTQKLLFINLKKSEKVCSKTS